MAAIAPIAIVDGQSTPVTHTFNPVQSMMPATFNRNGLVGVPIIGEEQVKLSLRGVSVDSAGVKRAMVTLRVPVLEVPEGGSSSGYTAPPKIAFALGANIEFILPNRSTTAQRKDVRVLAANLLLNAQVIALIEALEGPY